MNKKAIKIVGVLALIASIIADCVSDWADEKEMEAMIDEKLDERGIRRLPEQTENKKE